MHLRPHHLLCIQKFTGHGYDAAFTAHMTEICTALARNGGTAVTVADGCDALCAACPHCIGGVCESAEKTAEMDHAVSEICGLSPGQTADWDSLRANAAAAILQTDAFRKICARCTWFSLCGQTEETQ